MGTPAGSIEVVNSDLRPYTFDKRNTQNVNSANDTSSNFRFVNVSKVNTLNQAGDEKAPKRRHRAGKVMRERRERAIAHQQRSAATNATLFANTNTSTPTANSTMVNQFV